MRLDDNLPRPVVDHPTTNWHTGSTFLVRPQIHHEANRPPNNPNIDLRRGARRNDTSPGREQRFTGGRRAQISVAESAEQTRTGVRCTPP
jgi:hypothetical protein